MKGDKEREKEGGKKMERETGRNWLNTTESPSPTLMKSN